VNKLSRATVTTVDDIEPEAFRLAILYLIHRIYVGGPSVPLDEQIQIVWRIPKPESTSFKGVQHSGLNRRG
jgi:hypothetical protein